MSAPNQPTSTSESSVRPAGDSSDAHASESFKPLEVVTITPPPVEQRVARDARFPGEGETANRYHLPRRLESASPVGYRTRVSLTKDEVASILPLLSLQPPRAFADPRTIPAPTEQELFEEASLGVLSARQSTNYRGQRQVTLGPKDTIALVELLARLSGVEAPPLDGVAYAHVLFSKPYVTPFTTLLTFVGHKPVSSLLSVPARLWAKQTQGASDIPSIAALRQLHVGILCDAVERAIVIASEGRRRGQFFVRPFTGETAQRNRGVVRQIETLCRLERGARREGWRIAAVVLVGAAMPEDRFTLPTSTWRRLGANLLALRSERIQPGVNQEAKAPAPYQARQDMDVDDRFVEQSGRAAYNAFARWSGLARDEAKRVLLLDRIDVNDAAGRERLRDLRTRLDRVTDWVVRDLPKWVDLPTGRALSRNAERGRKAFALAGQRVYIAGLSQREVEALGMDWDFAIRAVGAASARASLYAELLGATEIPPGCDLLAGVCMMAGPVNQSDIGKQFYGQRDLLADAYPDRDPTALLVWTLKAKTVADPIGNEEQLLNAKKKGALVDLRAGPHEVVGIVRGGKLEPMRLRDGLINDERAYGDVGNFAVEPPREGEGGAPREIEGNRGSPWPRTLAEAQVWR